jgi:hypothetical protein
MLYDRLCYQIVIKGPDNSLPIQQYLIELDLYLELIKNRTNQSSLLLGDASNKPGSAFIKDGHFCFYTTFGHFKQVPIGKTFVTYHTPEKQYRRQDFIFDGLAVYVAKKPVKGIFNSDDWVPLKTGHLLDDLVTYKNNTKLKNQYLVAIQKDVVDFYVTPQVPETVTTGPDGTTPPPVDPPTPPVTGVIVQEWILDIDNDGYLRLTTDSQKSSQYSVDESGYLVLTL